MREALGQAALEFHHSALFTRTQSSLMRGPALGFCLHTFLHRVFILVVHRSNLILRLKGALAAPPKTYAAFCVAPFLLLTNPNFDG
jgi:hypothetical protein